MALSNISAKTTHDLWIESRKFKLEIDRPSPTSIRLRITRPTTVDVVDGAVITLHDQPISAFNYPEDGNQYAASTDWAAPAAALRDAGGARVVGFYSQILNIDWPAAEVIDNVHR
jgi:hypothetical protein